MAKIKLAEALLRRKELEARLKKIEAIKQQDVYEIKVKRINVAAGLDEVTAGVPKLALSQVMAEYNDCAKKLRLVDAAIQQANWTTEIEVGDVLGDYAPLVNA